MTDEASRGPEGSLSADDLGADPLRTCARWLEDAYARSNLVFPNAVSLSTVDDDGWPEGRIVLVKSIDDRGLTFFTNYRSRKAKALDASGRAAITFYWPDLNRQMRVRGPVGKVSAEESDRYFATRPRGSQIGAWASRQSEPLETREALEARCRELETRYASAEIPRPPHWGGYRLTPIEVEFWQGRDDRLHDRFLFRRRDLIRGEGWSLERLNP